MPNFIKIMLITISALISGCGGSDSCGSKLAFGALTSINCEGGNNILKGRFLDSAVEGLEYETPSRVGKTNSNGEFTYLEGELVTFKIYGVPIGSIAGTNLVTPISIAPITGAADFSMNVLRFLQSIDSDNNLGNGVQLPSSSPVQMPNFNQSTADFALAMAGTPIILVSEDSAWQHFQETLSKIDSSDNYIFNIAGKSAKAYVYGCKNNFFAFQLNFSATGAKFISGTDLFVRDVENLCTGFPTLEEDIGVEFPYADLKSDGFLIPCNGSTCTFNQLNNVYQGTDSDGRPWVQVVNHIKNSNQIISTKYIVRLGRKICVHKYLIQFY